MKELVTIQVGGFANFIGSHFWNFQDELIGLAADQSGDLAFKSQDLNMDVIYRTGETQQGILTYTPRLVSVDMRGSLGSMNLQGTLYNEVAPVLSDVITWTGNVSTHTTERHPKNLFLQSLHLEEVENMNPANSQNLGENGSQREFLDKDIVECLESGVKYWTDFSKVHYHPQSLYELSGVGMDSQEFDDNGIGKDSVSWTSQCEEISERLRFFVEECDQIQGFQFIADDLGGFSAVSVEFLASIADEYSKTPVLLYAARSPALFRNPGSRRQTISRDLNDAVSFSRLSSYCRLIVPVGLPFLGGSKASRFLHIEDEKPYHSSAVYAAALHSISLPFRMESVGPASCNVSGALDVNEVVQMLVGEARQNMVAILDAAMPAPSLTGKQNQHSLLENLQPLTPGVAEDVEDLQAVESLIVHGAFGSEGHRASVAEVRDVVHASFERVGTRPKFCHLSVASCPLPIPLPFPSIFGNLVGQNGELLGSPVTESPSRGSLDVHSIPMAARLRSSSAVLPLIDGRLRNLRRFGIDRGAPGTQLLRDWGFEKDEIEEMGETLAKMVNALDPRQTSSDSDY